MQQDQIGKYRVLGKIGHGAMGEVFKAHDAILNRFVAIKTIAADLKSDDTLRKRFEREAQSAARLNHPNVVTVYDFGEEHDKVYMAMELLEGSDLKHAIANHALPDLPGRLSIMEQICDGLAFAHAAEIVHRDLKPANIHLCPNGQVKIMDFGLARLSGSEMTRTGMVMGTPHYMSPEQVRGERADTRSDIFALGCVFYEMLTYNKPFDADSMHAVLFKVMQEDPTPLSEVAPETPPILVEIIDRALAKDPAERFQNAGALRDAVRTARQAVMSGRGHETLDALLDNTPRDPRDASRPPSVSEIARRATAAAARAERGPAASTRRAAAPPAPAPKPASSGPLYAAVALGAAAVVGGVVYAMRPAHVEPPPPPVATRPAQIDTLAQAVVGTQVELARKKLDAGDFRQAARESDRALKLDPKNTEARQIYDQAKAVIDRTDEAAAAAQAAREGGDAAKQADALWGLLVLDPHHALVDDMAPSLEGAFKAHAEDARKLMAQARADADKAKAGGLDGYKSAVASIAAAEGALKAGKGVSAARQFLDARDRFERARRSVQ